MKKLYALALSAGVMFSANAINVEKAANTANMVEFTKANTELNVTRVIQPKLNVAKAPTEGMPDVTGEYVGLATYSANTTNEKLGTFECKIVATEGDDAYEIEGLFYSDSDNVPCTVTYDEEYGLDILTIPGKGQVTLFTDSGQAYKLYLYGYDGGHTLYTNDLEFVVLGDALVFAYQGYGIAWVDSTNRGSWVVEPELYAPNGTYSGHMFGSMDPNTYEPIVDAEATTGPVYAEQDGTDLYIFNYCGFTQMVFTIETADEVVVANNVVADTYPTYGGNAYYEDFETMDRIIEGTIKNIPGDKSLIEVTTTWWVANDQAWFGGFAGNTVTLNFPIDGLPAAGVANVTVDENAPVEYFNLQGVRVANPESGLYIRRQGNVATKVLVK